ncbi:DUF4286 family protein [Pseudoxanthomonas wuyuanensis]
MEVIYEVSLEIDLALRDEYRPWLEQHVRQMLALPGFLGAEIQELSEPPPPPGRWCYCVPYRLRDHAALDAYLGEHAARMRADGIARFGDRFSASRRILLLAARY